MLGAASDASRLDAATDAFTPDARDTGRTIDVGNDAFTPSDAGRDAFTPSDAGRDMGVDSGMPGETACTGALASAVICDGFETDPGPWAGLNVHFGTVAADSLQAQRGTHALHAQITTFSGHAARYIDTLGPFTTGDIWIRGSLFIPSSAVVNDFTWFSIVENMPPYHGISLGMGSDLAVGSYSTISSTYTSDSALTLPRDTWTCLELHIQLSATAGSVEINRGGVLGASSTGINTIPAAGFAQFSVGIDYSSAAQGATEVWIDEVALSRSRLPCP